jgi:hypothetical protein
VRSRRIHIFGASGSGTSSLAAAVAQRHGHRHLDTDDFYWMPTDPPFQQVRPRDERLARLESAIEQLPTWVLSGSLCGWGDPLIPRFELVVLLLVPTPVRLARLRAREPQRYGAASIAAGGTVPSRARGIHGLGRPVRQRRPRHAEPGHARGLARVHLRAGGAARRRPSDERPARATGTALISDATR